MAPLDATAEPVVITLEQLSRAQHHVLRKYWASYVWYTAFHLVLGIPLMARGLLRAGRRNYRKLLWRRLLVLDVLAAPKGAHAFYGLGIGEMKKAVRFAELLSAKRGLTTLTVAETDDALLVSRGQLPFVAAPFNNPFSTWIFLRVLRPDALWVAENINCHHLRAMAALCRVPLVLFNGQDSILEEFRSPHAQWRVPLIGLYAVQTATLKRLILESGLVTAGRVWNSGPLAMEAPDLGTRATVDRLEVARTFGSHRPCPVVVAGCTWKADEEAVLNAFQALKAQASSAALIIAARDIARVGELEQRVREFGFAPRRLSEHSALGSAAVVVVDTMGTLNQLYSLCDVAFIGGTFDAKVGGHSLTEPLVHGVPVTCGPYFSHQQAIAELLLAQNLLEVCETDAKLADAWIRVVSIPPDTQTIQARFQQILEENRAATLAFFDAVTAACEPPELRPVADHLGSPGG